MAQNVQLPVHNPVCLTAKDRTLFQIKDALSKGDKDMAFTLLDRFSDSLNRQESDMLLNAICS
jgi:hypothetical protein